MSLKEHKITCPYCFETFYHEEVHFRMTSVGKNNPLFAEQPDAQYEKFWEEYSGSTEVTTNLQRRLYGTEVNLLPILNPNDPEHQKVLFKRPETGGYFWYDGDGMATAIRDQYGNDTNLRVCPHCHNPLPNSYGKTKTIFISVIGIRESGKTVYISQLLKCLPDLMAPYRFSVAFPDDNRQQFIENNPVEPDIPLPVSTQSGLLTQPVTFDITRTRSGGKKETFTFVLYDISGEDCVDSRTIQKYGPFIAHSNGIILLIPPKQIPRLNVSEQISGRDADPQAVINSLHNFIAVSSMESKLTSPLLAVCIPQFDRLSSHSKLGSFTTQTCVPVEGSEKFNGNDYSLLQESLAWAFKNTAIENDLINDFVNFNYFAFSATGCETRKEKREGDIVERSYLVQGAVPQPCRIEEPLLWMLMHWNYLGYDGSVRMPYMREHSNFKHKDPEELSFWDRLLNRNPLRPLYPQELKQYWYEDSSTYSAPDFK